jgi:glycine/D-amino acid oxidase-like deaminating enzyme/nitrite reductase/ring-hydroxylating ferredoxin subunit
MSVYFEKSRSCWMADAEPRQFPSLRENTACDAVIIGSGIAGLSTAYELVRSGRQVVVIDRGPIARGMSARTTAHLASALDDYYHNFIATRGLKMAQLHHKSHAAAIARIGAIHEEEGIECDFARLEGRLFVSGDTPLSLLDKERDALESVGLDGVHMDFGGSRGHRLSDGTCLIVPAQGRVHPLRYLDGLAEALVRRGGRLFADTCVMEIDEKEAGVEITTVSGFKLTADIAVVATNTPINDLVAIHTKQAPYRTYVIAGPVPKDSVADALYWDTEDPYHYVRLQPQERSDLLIAGGEDHKTGRANDAGRRLASLERWTRARFPELGPVEFRWSGQVIETIDDAAFIGINPGNERVFVVTGDSGQGITHSVAASLLIAGLADSGDHPWAEVYDPSRKPARAAGRYLSENLDSAQNLAEYLSPGEISSEDELRPGSGAILREGLRKLAVCRDGEGNLHRHSASCTHAGCIIHWNSFEQCWDCPCHGSHFAPDGTALNAPAIGKLAPAKTKALEPSES